MTPGALCPAHVSFSLSRLAPDHPSEKIAKGRRGTGPQGLITRPAASLRTYFSGTFPITAASEAYFAGRFADR